ncbi:MAG: gamma-butyrobetaine hydroxylase-like domain-containing protein [Pseudomonadota bacterium]
MSQPKPTDIRLHQKSRELEIAFDDGSRFHFPCEFLRVFSPSAEVQGHGPGQETLQSGKRAVNISRLEPVGNYAIQLYFDDGHDSGIYSWDLLYTYGVNQDDLWRKYLAQLEAAGLGRDSDSDTAAPGTGEVPNAVDANAPYRTH